MIAFITPIVANLFLWLWAIGLLLFLYLTKGAASGLTRKKVLILFVLIWVLGTRPVSETVIKPLESAYGAPKISGLRSAGVRQVVVLTGGGYGAKQGQLSAALPQASMVRFLSGLEVCSRIGPDCVLIFSGSAGRGRSHITTAHTMADLAALISPGITVIAEANSNSTAEHPQNVRKLLKPGPFIVITSAYHMPRTMRSFKLAGLGPIPYPVDYQAKGNYGLFDILPSISNFSTAGIALREYLALVLYTIKGW